MLEKIGKYEVSEQIGVGGFGAVYRGRDPFIKRTVAIKIIHPGQVRDATAAALRSRPRSRDASR